MSDNEYNSRDGDSPEETQRETVEDSLARLPAGPGAQSRTDVDSDALEKLRQQVRHWGSVDLCSVQNYRKKVFHY